MSPIIPFNQRDGVIWMDGSMHPWRDAHFHVLTHSLHYGTSIWEGIRSYDGVGYQLREHYERLHASATSLHYTLPYSVDALMEATQQLLASNSIGDGYIRPIAWHGSDDLRIGGHNSIHIAIAAWPWRYPKLPLEERGKRLMVSPWRTPPKQCGPVQAKCGGLYMSRSLSNWEAQAQGYDDALLLGLKDEVYEATTSNIFFIQGDRVYTPIADDFLNGITRQTLIAEARKVGIHIIETAIYQHQLSQYEGAFLTGTASGILPITAIGPHDYVLTTMHATLDGLLSSHIDAACRASSKAPS